LISYNLHIIYIYKSCVNYNSAEGSCMKKTSRSASGVVLRKRNYFDKLNVLIWFTQLLISYVVALS